MASVVCYKERDPLSWKIILSIFPALLYPRELCIHAEEKKEVLTDCQKVGATASEVRLLNGKFRLSVVVALAFLRTTNSEIHFDLLIFP